MNNPNGKINFTSSIDYQKVADTLCGALEGGSNYWYMIERKEPEDSKGFLHEAPFNGGALFISEYPDGGSGQFTPKKPFKLDLAAVEKGVQTMSKKYPKAFSDMLRDDGDANTSDILLQCCVFGGLIYG